MFPAEGQEITQQHVERERGGFVTEGKQSCKNQILSDKCPCEAHACRWRPQDVMTSAAFLKGHTGDLLARSGLLDRC